MVRITPVDFDEMPLSTRELVERVPFQDGAPLHLFTYTARQEALFPAWFRFTMSLLSRGELSQRERELAIVRTALHADSAYELAQHVELARRSGVTDAEFASLLDDAGEFDGLEADLIAFVDEMAGTGDVAEATWNRLALVLGERRMVELSMIVAYYQALGALLRVLRVPLEEGITDPR